MDKKRIKKRFNLQKRKKRILIILFLFLITWIYFSFNYFNNNYSNKVEVNMISTWSTIGFEKKIKKEVEYEDFLEIFTWTVVDRIWLEHDFDLTNLDLTGSILEIEFSTNNEFKSYPVLSAANLEKIKYGFMLWRLKNRYKTYWVWKDIDSVNINKYNVIELEEDWKIEFKAANLTWWILFVRITLKWRKNKDE